MATELVLGELDSEGYSSKANTQQLFIYTEITNTAHNKTKFHYSGGSSILRGGSF